MTDRILSFLKFKNIQSSKFADEIGVQRSSISHLLSGRNKPSLEFIQKILIKYPEVNPNWLLLGQGEMLLTAIPTTLFDQHEFENTQPKNQEKIVDLHDIKQVESPTISSSNNLFNQLLNTENKDIILNKEFESKNTKIENSLQTENDITNVNSQNNSNITEVKNEKDEKKLEKIVFFYSDKTFETYYPS